MDPMSLNDVTHADREAFDILQRERISDTMREAFRSTRNLKVHRDDYLGDNEERYNGRNIFFSEMGTAPHHKDHQMKRPSNGNISVGTALTCDVSNDEGDATSIASRTIPESYDHPSIERNDTNEVCRTKFQRLSNELIELKGDLAHIEEKEDDYKFTIQTLVCERDLLRMELMEHRNAQDIEKCISKRLLKESKEIRAQMAELQIKNELLEQQRDEYYHDRQQLQETLNRVIQSGRVSIRKGALGANDLIHSIQRSSRRNIKAVGQFWRRRN